MIRIAPSPLSRRRLVSGSLAAACAALAVTTRSHAASPPGDIRLLHATTTGYDGMLPGPPLQVRRGEELSIRLVNELPEPTAVHWHGVRTANAMDGAPPLTQSPIAPGESFDYRFIAPDAGTFWYHPPNGIHESGRARRDLCGALIVTESEPVDVDQDLTLVFATPSVPGEAANSPPRTDAPVTVNGTMNLDIHARANERLRLRLINATDGRILGVRVAGLRSFVMATDGEPAEPFAAREGRLLLGPGNRIDVFIDCTLAPGNTAPIYIDGNSADAEIARIICDASTATRAAPRDDPQALPPNPLPDRMDFLGAFRFDAAVGRTASRETGHKSGLLFAVKRARTVVLGLSNSTSENQYIHLHGHHFRLLDARDDGWKPFWLDTLPIAPGSNPRIAFVADNIGTWMIEGLISDSGASAWFAVT
ncbi:MAG: multicopper oxidase family protein [Xanthobacteraceae bacterium]|jgi:FtsP/CotA-like multicopper oxidase with cupredoxin domain